MAKSDGKTTLVDHINDCQKYAEYFVSEYKLVIENYCCKHNIQFDDFYENLKIAIHYHDFGKATNRWQNSIKTDKKLPPHSPFAGFFILHEGKKDLPSLLASVSHHSLLTYESANAYRKWIDYQFTDELNELNQFYNRKSVSINRNRIIKYFQNFFVKLRDSVNRNEYNTNFKALYCFYLFIICSADICASKYEETENIKLKDFLVDQFPNYSSLKNSINNIEKGKIYTKTQNKIIKNYKSGTSSNFLLEAPCGEGKTLASLLVAKKLIEEAKINRVIFALPTQTTSNNMLLEFESEYSIPQNLLSLYHSEVLNFLQTSNFEYDEELRSKIFLDSFYSNVFTVSTIDHLLLSLVNGYKYAPRAFGALQTSLVIIDEMHYYDTHTIGMIQCLLEILDELKIPYFIMSATIPKPIRDKIIKNDINYICSEGKSQNGDLKQSCKIEYHDKQLFEEVDKNLIINNAIFDVIDDNLNKNIGIIVNTVDKAKELCNRIIEEYDDFQIFMYHSQFTRIHRPIKEKILKIWMKHQKGESLNFEEKNLCKTYDFDYNKPLILIATQVIEISLNISFDVLISELAPLDSILQRLGRLHRSQNIYNSDECDCWQCQKLINHNYIAHVYDTGENCIPYYFKNKGDELKKEIIDKTRQVLNSNPTYDFLWSKQMMDFVYQNPKIFENFDDEIEFWRYYREDIIFGKNPVNNDETKNSRIKTRIIESQKLNVLPGKFKYKQEIVSGFDFIRNLKKKPIYFYNENFTSKGYNKISKYTVRVSKNKKNEFTNINGINVYPNYTYDFDTGLRKIDQFL